MKNKHTGCRRQFRQLSRAWYGDANLAHSPDTLDIITIGMYHDEGGTTGEFCIEWIWLSNSYEPELRAFSDSWDVLWEFRDVLQALKYLDGQNPTPDEICKLLVACNVEDATEMEQN